MNKDSKIYIAGHTGLVGSAIKSELLALGYSNLVTRTHSQLELTDQSAVNNFFETEKPEYVILSAAKVGGILANNTYPADFIFSNLEIQNNVIHQAYLHGVRKLLFLGSVCIYPKLSPQPIREEYLLTGPLEPTNEPYAIAKIAGMNMCQSYNRQYGTNFIAVMPTNLYGVNDNFDESTSHVLPAFIRKFHDAKVNNLKSVTVWGTGNPTREFMHVSDMAKACIYLLEKFDPTPEQNERGEIFFNVGTGEEISIRDLAEKIKSIVGYTGELVWDLTKPDGTPRRLLDVSRLHATGWKHTISLDEGIISTYKWFRENYASVRK